LNLSTDSSYRFERGVDVENVLNALDTAARLIAEVAGGVVSKDAVDIYRERFKPRTIDFRFKRTKEILGIEIGADEVEAIFKRLGMDVEAGEPGGGGTLRVDPPAYRLDLTCETDLLEEAARLFGYDRIPTVLPIASLMPGVGTPGIKRTIVEVLTNAGLFEVQNYSFVSRELNAIVTDKAGVEILNPLSEDQVVMRSSLLPSLLENLKANRARKNEFVRIFEVAPVFEASAADAGEGALPSEKWKVAGLLYGARWPLSWNNPRENLDFYDLTGLLEKLMEGVGIAGPLRLGAMDDEGQGFFHPGKAARIELGPEGVVGRLGEAHPDIMARFELKRPAFLFEIDIEAMAGAGVSGGDKSYSPLARFPESARDIAFIVDEFMECRKIINAIKKINTKLIEKVELFDVYYGGNIPEGKRSMALRVIYRSAERTLTQGEVEEIHSKVIGELSARFGVEIRGEGQKL
jgi:phenylalanyl-tRNA synthetase beta chain